MVETITPVVHGGSRSRWGVSVAVHAIGAAASAAVAGALLAAAGGLLGAPWGVAGLGLVAAAAALYVARELGAPVPVPQLRRQVPDWWRTFFPPHVAAFLYGIGLGPGFLTYLSHGTVVVVSVAAFASGRPLVGAAVLAPFGLARGLGPVLAFGVRSPSDGAALVERLERSASRARWRVANAVALAAVSAAMVVEIRTIEGPSGFGGLAAAVLALTFAAAAVTKLARGAAWRRTLARYRLPAGASRRRGPRGPDRRARDRRARGGGARFDGGDRVARRPGVVLRRRSWWVAFGRGGVWSAGASVVRRPGTTGCCSPATSRSPGSRSWRGRMGQDAPLVRSLREPGGADLLPAALDRARCSPSPPGWGRRRSPAQAGDRRVEGSRARALRDGRRHGGRARAARAGASHRPGRSGRHGREARPGAGGVRSRGRSAELADGHLLVLDRPLDLGSRELHRAARHEGRRRRRLRRGRPIERPSARSPRCTASGGAAVEIELTSLRTDKEDS